MNGMCDYTKEKCSPNAPGSEFSSAVGDPGLLACSVRREGPSPGGYGLVAVGIGLFFRHYAAPTGQSGASEADGLVQVRGLPRLVKNKLGSKCDHATWQAKLAG